MNIIELANDSGLVYYGMGKDRAKFIHHLEAFAKLVAEKLECYERLADASEMASNPMGVKSRVALRNPRVMTKEEEIRKAVEAEREACANALAYIESFPTLTHGVLVTLPDAVNAIRARSKHD